MVSELKQAANAVGGKTARACDSCLRNRARWFCAADDAFLCRACDAAVHSANQVARRHERVRLGTASSSRTLHEPYPAWHSGFKRKARTPRNPKSKGGEKAAANVLPLVPELSSEEASPVDNEDQLLYQVPVFEPLLDDADNGFEVEKNVDPAGIQIAGEDLEDFSGFLPSDTDLAELAADVENLLGCGADGDHSFAAEPAQVLFNERRVKLEVDEGSKAVIAPCQGDTSEEWSKTLTVDWDLDYGGAATAAEEDEQKKVGSLVERKPSGEDLTETKRNILLLRLNYEGVIEAWASQGSPWMDGIRPELNLHGCWPDFTGGCPFDVHLHHFGGVNKGASQAGGRGDGGREARVSRYREKRRTRLFSKKIRYEVRKLNAEKRPRMKGRFVKRTSFAAGPAPYPFFNQL